MTTKMALISTTSPTPTHSLHFITHKSHLKFQSFNKPNKTHLTITLSSSENNASPSNVVLEEKKNVLEPSEKPVVEVVVKDASSASTKFEKSEDSVGATQEVMEASKNVTKFKDARWINGTWDLLQFAKDGVTNWDAVIDAEAKRRKWLQTYPESTSNEEPIIFDTSIIPWWAWIKRFHLPEAELLNGRAAMVGFFMSYFVDSLTGLGVVDQMSNFFCKTLLFVSVLGVLFIRKNEDVENLKKLFEETTFYDKQWQATWQEETKKD